MSGLPYPGIAFDDLTPAQQAERQAFFRGANERLTRHKSRQKSPTAKEQKNRAKPNGAEPPDWSDIPPPEPDKIDSKPPENQQKPALDLAFGHGAALPQASATVIPGILYRRSITLIYGAPKSGKSFLATDLALAVADLDSDRWMDRPILHHGPVLYVACEGHGGFWKRLAAAKIHRQWDELSFPEQFILATGRPALIQSIDHGRLFAPDPTAITDALAHCHAKGLHPILVVIDTVFRSFGAGNVNSSDHMNAYLTALAGITDRDIALVIVHHETKSSGSPAGSVSLIGGSDNVIKVARDDTGPRSWELEMAKDDAEGDPVAFDLDVVDVGTDPDGQPATSCVVIPTNGLNIAASPFDRSLPKSQQVALRALAIALSKHGALLPPLPDYPSNTQAVATNTWRDEFYQLHGGEPEARRKAFQRAQQDLLAAIRITQRDNLTWIVSRKIERDIGRDIGGT